MATNIIIRSVTGERFTHVVETSGHQIFVDQPESAGGSGLGPGPYEYLLAALGTWTSMTLRMYAERKGLALERVRIKLSHERIHSKDCEDCETKAGMLDEIHCVIQMEGNLDGSQRQQLLKISNSCPVHRIFSSEVKIRTTEAWL